MFQLISRLCFVAIALLYSFNTLAVPSMALGYTPKYKSNFSHFNYVNPNAPKNGTINLSAFGTYETLNPFLLKSISADGLGLLMFESLMEKSLDEPFSAYGLLAKDIQLAKDKLSVTFTINEKARFNDGSEVTATDVKFSFDTLTSDQAHPQFKIYYGDIKNAVVLDKYRVKFNFVKTNPELHLVIGDMPVFSKAWLHGKAFDKTLLDKPITSGPYIIDSFQPGKLINYKKNPNYWAKDLNTRKGMFNFERINYKYFKDLTVALEAFKAGDFDFILENHSKRWARDYNGSKFKNGTFIKQTLKHSNNAGIQGFIFNTRKAKFSNPKTRQAIAMAFDFEWSNKNLFYGQYTRCNSYFSNSEMAAKDAPTGLELQLLSKHIANKGKGSTLEAVFKEVVQPPKTTRPNSLRKNLRQATKLLKQAGWKIKNGKLQNNKGESLDFTFLLAQKGFERIIAPFVSNLKKLGITASYRTIDTSLYQRKVETYDFDMVVMRYGQSQSPGNELKNYFSSQAAAKEGSLNLAGISSPVVDSLIDEIIYSKDRLHLVTASRALDRVLLAGHYLIPNWYINVHRVAYKNNLEHPKTLPLYYEATPYMLKTWWLKE